MIITLYLRISTIDMTEAIKKKAKKIANLISKLEKE